MWTLWLIDIIVSAPIYSPTNINQNLKG